MGKWSDGVNVAIAVIAIAIIFVLCAKMFGIF